MGLIKQNVTYRIASFVRRAKMKINSCFAMDATRAIIPIASNQKWWPFRMVIGMHCFISEKLKIPFARLFFLYKHLWRCFLFSPISITSTHRYCYECVNKATNERKCIVCGGHRPPPLGKMVYCELCPRAYHHDCYIPPLIKVPRGKWYCQCCTSKAPPPRRRGPSKKLKDTKDNVKDSRDTKDEKTVKDGKDARSSSKSDKRSSKEHHSDNSLSSSTIETTTTNQNKHSR